MSREQRKYADLKGAEQGYAARGKDFRQELRHLKKLKRGDALSTRGAHRLHYLQELRKRRIPTDIAKTVGTVATTALTGGLAGGIKGGLAAAKTAAKEGFKKLGKGKILKGLGQLAKDPLLRLVGTSIAGKTSTALARKKMKRKMEEASSRVERAKAFGDYGGVQDIQRAGAHYTPGLEAAIPLATSAAMRGLSNISDVAETAITDQPSFLSEKSTSGVRFDPLNPYMPEETSPDLPSMTGLDEIIGDYEGPKLSDGILRNFSFGLEDYDPMSDLTEIAQPEEYFDDSIPSPASDPRSFPEAKDWLELQRDKFDARRKGIDIYGFEEEPGFEFPESDPIPLPEITLDPITTIPPETIDTGVTAPESLTISPQKLQPTQQRSTLEELTTTEYFDLLDEIEAEETTSPTVTSISDEDLLAMENSSGYGTYQEMFDQYKQNTSLSDEEIMKNIRQNAENAGDLPSAVGTTEIEVVKAEEERKRFIEEHTKRHGFPPRKQVVDIHMKKWEKGLPERERDARIEMARERAEALLGEYDIPFDPNEPTPNISYEKGGKLQDHTGSIKATRKYIMNKYA